jgi:2-dehydro-3-deoxyphosphogluconate aldolase/(4S)-4-hydroxy-2-oxoglutarate aldolase
VHTLADIAPKRIVPVVVVPDSTKAPRVRDSLKAGGLCCAEITLRTPDALSAIRSIAQDEGFTVGAGTVVSVDQVAQAADAGASFVVSPGLSRDIASECTARNLPYFPGVSTASEIMWALELGLTDLKFFPAEASGGLSTIKALAAPFPGVKFMPTGGVRADSLADYLASPSVGAVGGTWFTPATLQAADDFDEITRLTAEAIAIAESTPC